MVYPATRVVPLAAETCASFNWIAHSSQQTSTLRPPTLTSIELASSLQSHAAHVFSFITLLPRTPEFGVQAVGHGAGEHRCQNL